jgi:hypothetical protein
VIRACDIYYTMAKYSRRQVGVGRYVNQRIYTRLPEPIPHGAVSWAQETMLDLVRASNSNPHSPGTAKF